MLKFENDLKEETPRSRDVATPVGSSGVSLPPSVDSPRVRPEELSEALAALEQKKRKAFTGTIPLEQTLADMNTEVTQHEVWAEIQQQRQQRQVELRSNNRKKRVSGANIVVGGAAILAALIIAISVFGLFYPERSQDVMDRINAYLPQNPSEQKGESHPILNGPPGSYYLPKPEVVAQQPTMKRLSDIKDGEVLTINLASVYILHKAEELGQKNKEYMNNIYVETKPNHNNAEVVRYNHQWYVRGWTTEKPLTIHNNRLNRDEQILPFFPYPVKPFTPIGVFAPSRKVVYGPTSKQVQIPLKFSPEPSSGGSENMTTFTYSGSWSDTYNFELSSDGHAVDPAILDSHAWDKWEPRAP